MFQCLEGDYKYIVSHSSRTDSGYYSPRVNSRVAREEKAGHSSDIIVDGVLFSSSDIAATTLGLPPASIRKCARLRLSGWSSRDGSHHTAYYKEYY